MRPKITCHMVTSLDGRLHPGRWTDPVGGETDALIDQHYDRLAATFEADGWIVGRKSMAEYLGEEAPQPLLDTPVPRPGHAVDPDGRQLAIVIDPSARIAFESSDIDGEQAVALVSERVSDSRLDALKDMGVAYGFAGPDGKDLRAALEWLGQEMGAGHLLLEGGGATNGAFLSAGLIDETSTLVFPAIDGQAGVPAIYEHTGPEDARPAAGQPMRLVSCDVLDGGVVWLRHEFIRP